MTKPIRQAILLAAGFGTRLKPLTLTTPKPLLPLDGMLLIDHQLRYLHRAGIETVVINLHHLGEKIRAHVGDGSRYGLEVHYSEETTILGTGGGIRLAATLLENGPFLLLNADAFIDVDLAALEQRHQESGALVTMALKRLSPEEKQTPIALDADGFIRAFGEGSHFYIGAQAIDPRALDALPPAGTPSCLIRNGYDTMLSEEKTIAAFIHDGYANDLGTPERYEQAKDDIAQGRFTLCNPEDHDE